MKRARLIACVALGLFSSVQAAQPARPDFSGFWTLARGKLAPDKALLGKLSPDAVLLDDVGAPELPKGDWGGLKPTAKALAAAAKWDPAAGMTVSMACSPPSIVYALQGPFPIEIHQGTELIVIQLEFFDLVRIVHIGGKPWPADAPHSKVGHSVGHWEGDTLVVDTTHLMAATLLNNGLDHSDKVRVHERFKLSADGKQLLATQEYEDPEMLVNRGARYIAWTRVPNDHVHAYDCDPSYAENYAK